MYRPSASKEFGSFKEFTNYIGKLIFTICASVSAIVLLLVFVDVPLLIEPNKSLFSPDLGKVVAPNHKYWLNLLLSLLVFPTVAFVYYKSFSVQTLSFKPEFKLWMAIFIFVVGMMMTWMQFSGFHGEDGRFSKGFATTVWGVHVSSHLIFIGVCFTWTQTLFYITDKLGIYRRRALQKS